MTRRPLRYPILATDYDGTLADRGTVAPAVIDGLVRLRASGRRLVLVTGRELEDLSLVFPELDLFDRIVAENGAVLYRPSTGDLLMLGDPPGSAFVDVLRADGVRPLAIGRVIVATLSPHEDRVRGAIAQLGLAMHVIYNKGAVMVLPAGIDKASGLRHALHDLRGSAAETVALGDAENDEALLAASARGVAVANAVPTLKAIAQQVTAAPAGDGVLEVIEELLAADARDE